MLATSGNVVGATKNRRGTKVTKDRITVGLFVNATGSDFWKPCVIGTAKKPRCFGQHWHPKKVGALYYNNDTAWMRENIWIDMLKEFNMYCYAIGPVVLLADNCPCHKPPPGSTPWQNGHLRGFQMSNVLVIFFEPNCTAQVQPLDAGMIQTAKAHYRKRQMSWILDVLNNLKPGEKPVLRCSIRQGIEWFMFSLKSIPPHVVKNCWIKTKILTPAQMEELRTGICHNDRVAANERGGLPADIVDDLSTLLQNLGKKISVGTVQVKMATAVELLDLPAERVTEAPPVLTEEPEESATAEEAEEATVEGQLIEMSNDIDVDEIEPPPPMSLKEAREAAHRLLEFVTINKDHVKRAGPSNKRDYVHDVDVLSQALAQMNVTSKTRQTSMMAFAVAIPRPVYVSDDDDAEP